MTGERSGQAGWPGPSEVGSKGSAGRQDSPVPLACSQMPKANEGLGGQERLRNRSEPGQVVQAGFEPERIAVTQRVNGCYCVSARCRRLWRIQSKRWTRPMKPAERRTKGAQAPGRTRRLGKSRENLSKLAMLKTMSLGCEPKAT